MKTTILFSSIFYLIGLTIGSAVEHVKNSLLPSGSVITMPAKKAEKPEKAFHFKSNEKEITNKKTETDPAKEKGSATFAAPGDSLIHDQG